MKPMKALLSLVLFTREGKMHANAMKLMRYMMESDNDIKLVLTPNGVVITDVADEGIVLDEIGNTELVEV